MAINTKEGLKGFGYNGAVAQAVREALESNGGRQSVKVKAPCPAHLGKFVMALGELDYASGFEHLDASAHCANLSQGEPLTIDQQNGVLEHLLQQ